SFNHSTNSASQVSGYGANGAYSAILGGMDHNIDSGNTYAAIVGGNGINLTGDTYSGHTAVGSLVVWDQPLSGASGDDVLVWDSVDKKVKVRTQSDVAGASDAYLKSNIKISKNSLDKINTLSGYEFEWNENYPDYSKIGMKDYGLLAQEVEALYPEMVTEDFRANDGKTYKAIKYNRLIPILVNAVNELTNRVEYLENKFKIKN
ncbi:MAG: tail fiber domain-containing protein, partial [bacterium]